MGAAGDVDYERGGGAYSSVRRADARIAAVVHDALGAAASVVNVGAGAGSYEPAGRFVVAVEPSAVMRAQRPAGAGPVVDAVAEQLPFAGGAFDAAMATVTVHQWRDPAAGLREMRRVSSGTVVILTFDRDSLGRFWLADYAPDVIAADERRYPPLEWIAEQLGGAEVDRVPIPVDCADGFCEAFYARPERFLEESVRRSQSAWGFVDRAVEEAAVDRLRRDLESGAWEARYGHLAGQPTYDGSLRLVRASR